MIKQLREGEADFFIALIDEARAISKSIWDNINEITKCEDKSIQNWVLKDKSEMVKDNEQIATIFNTFFVD